jgi:hypothetical protein
MADSRSSHLTVPSVGRPSATRRRSHPGRVAISSDFGSTTSPYQSRETPAIVQHKAGWPVQFEITERSRVLLQDSPSNQVRNSAREAHSRNACSRPSRHDCHSLRNRLDPKTRFLRVGQTRPPTHWRQARNNRPWAPGTPGGAPYRPRLSHQLQKGISRREPLLRLIGPGPSTRRLGMPSGGFRPVLRKSERHEK